jgi:hypothetical protein
MYALYYRMAFRGTNKYIDTCLDSFTILIIVMPFTYGDLVMVPNIRDHFFDLECVEKTYSDSIPDPVTRCPPHKCSHSLRAYGVPLPRATRSTGLFLQVFSTHSYYSYKIIITFL